MNRNPFEDADCAGVYHWAARDFSPVLKAVAADMDAVKVQIPSSGDLEEMLRELGRLLHFPAWYGANLDALHDCLTDPDWHPEPGPVLLITGLEHLRAEDPERFSSLMEVFLSATEARRDAGKSLWVIVDTPARGVPVLTVS